MKYSPILFSTPMVQAITAGRKSMTRRVAKDVVPPSEVFCLDFDRGTYGVTERYPDGTPVCQVERTLRYKPGDILWVRETWREFSGMFYGWQGGAYIPLDDFEGYNFKADDSHYFTKGANPFIAAFEDMKDDIKYDKWRSSRYMPKAAARLFLRVTDVRAERLIELTGDDARKEGIEANDEYGAACYHFRVLWNSLNAKRGYGWDKNPWVWVYSFERIDKPEGWPNV